VTDRVWERLGSARRSVGSPRDEDRDLRSGRAAGADRAAGYWWDISMRQVGVSRTIVFDAPRAARGFFEALCIDNLDIGRPEEMQIVFGRRVRAAPVGGYRTRLLRRGDEVTLNAFFRHSRAKSYLSVSVRAVSLRAPPLSGSRDQPWWKAGGPRPCGSAPSGHDPGR
jgi:hypothetical protein